MIQYLLIKSNSGKFRFAIVEFIEEWKPGFVIQRSHGQVGGKVTLSPTILITEGKQGRSPYNQAILKFNSLVKEFLDRGYKKVDKHPQEYSTEELENLFGTIITNQFGVIKPMLAKQEAGVINKKIYDKEWLGSRKINGVRALFYYDGKEIHCFSRGGSMYDNATIHLRTHPELIQLFKEFPHLILDSELYKHGVSLQKISGAARLETTADYDWLEMWVYDCYFNDNSAMFAKDRIAWLQEHLSKYGFDPYKEWNDNDLKLQLLPHIRMVGFNSMMKYHDDYVREGFEGLVIRNPNAPYKPNGRGNDMIKIKKYKDSEYKIVDYKLGLRGSEDMCFICEMKDGRTFSAMPIGDRGIKQEYIDNFESKYKNQIGTCKYFELSEDGIPCQPKFIAFRYDI